MRSRHPTFTVNPLAHVASLIANAAETLGQGFCPACGKPTILISQDYTHNVAGACSSCSFRFGDKFVEPTLPANAGDVRVVPQSLLFELVLLNSVKGPFDAVRRQIIGRIEAGASIAPGFVNAKLLERSQLVLSQQLITQVFGPSAISQIEAVEPRRKYKQLSIRRQSGAAYGLPPEYWQ